MKKIIALLLVAVMALGMFAACAKTPDPTDPPAAAPADTAKPADTPVSDTAESDDPNAWIWEDRTMSGKVNFYMPFKGNQGMDALIAEFNEYYPNIEVTLVTYNNNADGNTGVNTAIIGGQVDVLVSFNMANTHTRWSNGLFMDLTDKVEEEGIDLVKEWGTDVYKYEDSIYTFPCGGRSHYVIINMDKWKAAGLDQVYNGLPTEWTWDEYLDACKKMTEVDASGNVTTFGGTDFHNFDYVAMPYASVVGVNPYYDEDGTSSFDNDYVIDALERELQAELVDKIWHPRARYTGDNTQTQDAYTSKLVASAITNNTIRFLHDPNYAVDFVSGFAPYPVLEKGQTNYMSGVEAFSHAGIALNCQDEDAAWAFLKWYATYGVKYLAAAGHQPNWTGTEAGSGIEAIYGSEEEAAKWIDVESFKRVVGVPTNPSYVQTELTAYSDVSNALREYVTLACGEQMTAEEAMLAAAEKADAAIEKEKN